MEIIVNKDKDLSNYNTGGGTRDLTAVITLDDTLSPRMKRHTLIYETLGIMLGYAIAHEQLEGLADILVEALDQLEPVGGKE